MEFTHEQISKIISEITNGEQGLQGLVEQGQESLTLSERSLHNAEHENVSKVLNIKEWLSNLNGKFLIRQ